DRVVDEHDALAGEDLAHRIELDPHAGIAATLLRLDERAADVVIADQAELEADTRSLAVAERDRVARVGHRDHDVGLGRMFARERVADPAAHAVHRLTEHAAIGPREV